jgi:uridine kinase
LVSRIQELLYQRRHTAVSIDGPCGSGKSTLAEYLQGQFPGSIIIHADDFFLQPHQRTPQRMSESGGNMDRERLQVEVLECLHKDRPFAYQRYDCQSGVMTPVEVLPAQLYLIEGAYSQHPDLGKYYDLKVFLEIDGQTQLQRLRQRVPTEKMDAFLQKWIPLEQQYFSAFKVKENSGFVLSV